jgi:hypothetical protein
MMAESLEQRKQRLLDEMMAAGAAGFTGAADPAGPVAGYDPVMGLGGGSGMLKKFDKMLAKRRKKQKKDKLKEAYYGGEEQKKKDEKKAAYEKQLKKMLPKRAFDQLGRELDPRSGKLKEEILEENPITDLIDGAKRVVGNYNRANDSKVKKIQKTLRPGSASMPDEYLGKEVKEDFTDDEILFSPGEIESLSEKLDGKSAKDKDYSLHDWFKGGGWKQAGGKYDGKPCAKQPGQTTKPFCRDADDRAAMSKDERDKRAAKKRREDPDADRKGKAKMVHEDKTFQDFIEEKDACYHKVKARYDVWPSAYASGALVKCRKKGASSWGEGGKSKKKDS